MKIIITLMAVLTLFKTIPTQAGNAYTETVRSYLSEKCLNPNLSDSAKKKILANALKNAAREVAKLKAADQVFAQAALNSIRELGGHSEWTLVIVAINQLNERL